MDIHHHGPRPISIICHLRDPPTFSLPTTFKYLIGVSHLPGVGAAEVAVAAQQFPGPQAAVRGLRRNQQQFIKNIVSSGTVGTGTVRYLFIASHRTANPKIKLSTTHTGTNVFLDCHFS
jgi:hypothetical protein